MSNPARLLGCLLALLLAGCSTAPRRNLALVPDWEGTDKPSEPSAPPPVAPVRPAPIPTVAPPIKVAAPTQAPVPPSGQPVWVPVRRWARDNGFPAPELVSATSTPTCVLRTTNGALAFRAGSELARWDGLEVHLGFAPQWIDGQPYLHALDLTKTIRPLLTGRPSCCVGARPVVVLDPGHGGGDAGAKSALGIGYEKEFTLDWARRLQALLTANGWQVFLTRASDADLPLSNRVACAEAHQADLFLSLHFNSAALGETEAGLETYCLTPTGLPSSLTRGYADDFSATFPNNAFDAQNLLLALTVHRALLQVNGHHDRGVRRARFPAVLRGQQRPAILIEGGYLSNVREARLIADPAYRQRLAEAVCKALESCVRRDT